MNDSEQILEHMCRACMGKDRTFHLLCDKPADNTLTIYELLDATIPQVPIHSNDELPKKICEACLNTLIIVHKFQQMCIASDTYMRSLLVSNRLVSHSSIIEQQEETKDIPMTLETENMHISLAREEPQQSLRSVKVETNDDALNESEFIDQTTYCQEIDTMVPKWSDDDDIPLKKSGNRTSLDCMKFGASDMEMQESDLMTNLRSENNLLKNREVHIAIVLEPYKDSDTNLEWNDGDNSNYQKESASDVRKAEQQQPSPSSVTDETDNYKIEKPYSSFRHYRFLCSHCDAVFPNSYRLEEHSHVHDETRPFVCQVCNYRFANLASFACHKNTHKITPPGGFKCPKCPRRFEKQISIMPHMRTHRENNDTDINSKQAIGDEKFPCPNCDKTFSAKSQLKKHSHQHDKKRLFACEVCNYRFETKAKLFRHTRHYGHKMIPSGGFECPLCPRRFVIKNSLVAHVSRSHNFKCNLCQKKFGKMTELKDHLRQHKSNKFMHETENDNMGAELKQSTGDHKMELTKKVEWNKESTLKVIELWEQHSCLYDCKSSLYHNKQARYSALTKIAEEMMSYIPNVQSEDIKSKLNNLRSQFNNELSKQERSYKNGCGTVNIYEPTLYFFEKLTFLKQFLKSKKGKSNSINDPLSPSSEDNFFIENLDSSEMTQRSFFSSSSPKGKKKKLL